MSISATKSGWNPEEVKYLQEFEVMGKAEQKRELFQAFMGLLAEAVRADDVVMMRSYARLVTEMFFDEGEMK